MAPYKPSVFPPTSPTLTCAEVAVIPISYVVPAHLLQPHPCVWIRLPEYHSLVHGRRQESQWLDV